MERVQSVKIIAETAAFIVLLGDRIHIERAARHISQVELSYLAHTTTSTISKLERGTATNINIRTIISIALALEIDTLSLFQLHPKKKADI